MLYNILSDKFSDNTIIVAASVIAFALTYVLLARPFSFLPTDGGKYVIDKDGNKVAINANSNGKVTGVGLVFVVIYLLISLLMIPFSNELMFYIILSTFMMLTGYFDDTSKNPWGELVKGILDLVLALGTVIVFLVYNSSEIVFLGKEFKMPVVVYAILAVALIWGSINVTNCSDGVDGLCGTVSVIEIFAIVVIFKEELGKFTSLGIILAFVLVAYLAYNWNPSSVLMGDAGSRTIGFTLALLCMKTHHPYAFLILSLVFILDGGLGLMKLAIMRVTKKPFLVNIRFPIHDELRKNRGMKIPLIVLIMAVSESVMCAITSLIIYLSNK